ncbi:MULTISPECIES: YIP1 family protein [Salinibaculum]|uniref:YIP1 family protein n=1 Tax=Salinibaculum TaxID=2732368 RepID=UPI0030D32921
MTQWVENTGQGRDRGPVALGLAWVEVLVRPRQFFARRIAPGDQAPGLTFAAVVVFVAELTRIATVSGAYPVVAGQPLASAALWLLATVVLVMPAGIHLTAALQTVVLIGTVEERAGVSETVQVICYALAPLALLGVPSIWLQAAVGLWSLGLMVLGMAVVHDISLPRAVGVAGVPVLLLVGYGFGVVADLQTAAALVAG